MLAGQRQIAGVQSLFADPVVGFGQHLVNQSVGQVDQGPIALQERRDRLQEIEREMNLVLLP